MTTAAAIGYPATGYLPVLATELNVYSSIVPVQVDKQVVLHLIVPLEGSNKGRLFLSTPDGDHIVSTPATIRLVAAIPEVPATETADVDQLQSILAQRLPNMLCRLYRPGHRF